MGFHHVALATNDLARTHAFYTEAMGFELVKTVVAPSPEGGWARHVFYDTGGDGLMAFWDLHGEWVPPVDGALSRAVGLPEWVNHIAFTAVDPEHLASAQKRWASFGLDVIEVDHGFVRSIYTLDPNGTAVEWCLDVRPLDETDRAEAIAALEADSPELEAAPVPRFVPGDPAKRPAWAATR